MYFLLGYPNGKKGLCFYDLKSHNVFVLSDVIFEEFNFSISNSYGKKGRCFYDFESHNIFVSRDIIF